MASARNLKPVSAGALRYICDIEAPDPGKDNAGIPKSTFSVFARNVYFDFADYRGSEASQANQVGAALTTYITIRWLPGIAANMRLKHISDFSQSPPIVDYYDITAIPQRDGSMRNALLLQCVRRDAAGYRTGAIP